LNFSFVEPLFYQAYTKDFTGLELEDGGGRGTAGMTLDYVLFDRFMTNNENL
jgi:hypothetical protein